MIRVLITGGCGFLGHHVVDHIIKNTDWEIAILDRLSYSSNGFDRLRDSNLFDESRIAVLSADFTNPIVDGLAQEIGDVDYIVHLGAETHVDNSIVNPRPFVFSNVIGTMEVLEFARTLPNLKKFIYFSTDEVFGPSDSPFHLFKEWDRYKSSNPYSASKAGGEELAVAYHNTYNVPVVIIHTMNIYGERQHPEKFIPKAIRAAIRGETVTVHGRDGEIGTRCWIHARNVADSILFLLERGVSGEKYNVAGQRASNLDVARIVVKSLCMPGKYRILDGESVRPGYDLHYGLDVSKMKRLGWQPPIDFVQSLEKTVLWFDENRKWLRLEESVALEETKV